MSSHPGAAAFPEIRPAASRVAGWEAGIAGLVPAPPGRTISRPALDAKLDAAAGRRLTVVCAGAGWGKTLAVSRWIANRPPEARPVAWVTVQPHLDDAASFWQEVIEAIRTAAGVGPEHPLSALSASAGVPEEVMTSILQALDALPVDVLLALDDFQEVSDPRILESVARLAHRATRVHVLVLSRFVPPLRHHRLRVSDQMSELTAVDLAFTADEVRQLARMHALELSWDQATDLVARTEGWPAGVQLALLHAARDGVGALTSFVGTERSVAEYLLTEVIERTSPQVREFLLRTSVVQPVSADLAAAVVPGPPGQQILENLEACNEFVTSLGPDRAWFRYHPLLRDVLEHELRRDDPEGFREAHRRAARWWTAHDDPIEGLGHGMAARDWELVGRIYTSAAGPALVGARRDALHACLSALPQTADAGIEATLARAGLAFADGRVGALSALLDTARAALAEGAAADPPARVLLELLTVGAHRFAGDAAATVRASAQAVRMLDAAEPFPAAHGYRTVARQSLGVGQLWSGHPAAADVELRSLLASSREPAGVDLVLLAARSNLALTTAALGQLRQAEQLAQAALDRAAARGWTGLLQARGAHLALAWVHLLRGEWDRAGSVIAAGLAAVEGGAEPPASLLLLCLQTEEASARGRLRASRHGALLVRESVEHWEPQGFLPDVVEHALTAADLVAPGPIAGWAHPPGPPIGKESPTQLVCRARRLAAAGGLREVDPLVAPVIEGSEPETVADLITMVDAWLLTSAVHDREGRTEPALAALDRAVRLASPQDLAHPFLTSGSTRLRALLAQLIGGTRGDAAFVARLVSRLGGTRPPGPEPEPLVEPLTQRELAMLHALPTLKSNNEIAADAYVSINTVKAHLKGLYRKLGVSSRRGAVERARELGLLP